MHLDQPETLLKWEKLITAYQVKGKRAHDVRLIASMMVHQISHILTFNTKDFEKFTEIQVFDPRTLK